MKDGSVVTNPGILNPDVLEPIGKPDPELLVLLASSEGITRGGLVNYGLHGDTTGETSISADWTHYLREQMRKQFGAGLSLLTPIACCGDVNHWNVFKPVTSRGFEEAERIGNKLATAALAAAEQAEPIRPAPVCALRKTFKADTRMSTEEELAKAKELLAKPAPTDVDFTIDRVAAQRRVNVAKLGPSVKLDVSLITFGNVAIVGLPCEAFSALGRSIKSQSPFDHTFIATLTDRYIGYIGERDNYEEGGYEMTSSVVVPGTGEVIVDTAVGMLNDAGDQCIRF